MFNQKEKKIIEPIKYPFEDFLQSIHAESYAGTDDDMNDNYEHWLSNLDLERIIRYGNQALNIALNINKIKKPDKQ